MKLIVDNKSSGSEEEIQMHKTDQESDFFKNSQRGATDMANSNMTFLAKGDADGVSEGTTWIVRGNNSDT